MIIKNLGINFAGGGGSCPPGECTLQRKNFSITTNGDTSITPDSGKDGISAGTISVNVDMAPAYSSGFTEGFTSGETAGAAAQKALLSSTTITENGTVTSENGFSAVTVNVPSTQPVLSSATFTENGTYTPGSGVDGFSAVTVSVSGGGGGNKFNDYLNKTITAVTYEDMAGVTALTEYAFASQYEIRTAYMPYTVSGGAINIGQRAFQYCRNMTDVYFSHNASYIIPSDLFQGCTALTNVDGYELYTGQTLARVFQDCKSLSGDFRTRTNNIANATNTWLNCSGITSFTFLNDMSSAIKDSAFYGCTGVQRLDFTHNTAVPTLSNVNTFSAFTANYEVWVPQSLYDTWVAANNWSSISSHIVAKSTPTT